MAQGFRLIADSEDILQSVIAKNSEVFAEASPVTINSSGFLAVAAAGEKIYGFCSQAGTALSTNQNGTVPQTNSVSAIGWAPRVIGYKGVQFWADGDGTITQTKVGEYADIASSSAGVVTMNNTTGATGQFLLLGLDSDVDPSSDGDTDRGVYLVAEPQQFGFAQS